MSRVYNPRAVSSDLERFRDHCRTRTEPYDDSSLSAPCRGTVFGARGRGPQHDWCGSDTCRCHCHAPTEAERALWAQMADEIDAHLAAQDQPMLGDA